jgi:hypothetical protein
MLVLDMLDVGEICLERRTDMLVRNETELYTAAGSPGVQSKNLEIVYLNVSQILYLASWLLVESSFE